MNKRDIRIGFIIGALIGVLAQPVLSNLNFSFSFVVQISIVIITAFGVPAGLKAAQLLSRHWAVLWQIAKFGATGVLNTLLDFGILNLLSSATGIYSGLYLVIFNTVSFGAAVINSYFWNKYWTFGRRDAMKAREFIQFVVVSVIGLLINDVIIYVLTSVVGAPDGFTLVVWENIAKAIGIPVSFAWNFSGYKFVVFKPSSAPVDNENT